MADRKYFIGSVGEPNEGYDDENLNRCIKYKVHAMNKDTKQKGVFNKVEPTSIIFLKYKGNLVSYGEVKNKSTGENDELADWNWIISVKDWVFKDKTNPKIGVSNSGISLETKAGAGQMATIKEISADFGLAKMREIDASNSLYLTVIQEMKMENYIKEKVDLLKSNKNIILTGAPGTGKTYLAKQIAEEVIKGTTQKGDAMSILKDAIDKFQKDDTVRNEQQRLLKEFQRKFSMEKLDKLTLDEYCIGKGNSDTFCGWIEYKLQSLGQYSGFATKFKLYWNGKKGEYSKTGFIKNLSDDESINKIATLLYSLVNEKQFGDFAKDMSVGFALKILNSYNPEAYFPINNNHHIDNVLNLFNINCDGDYYAKNKAILDFYKNQIGTKDITSFEFMHLLYSNFNISDGELKNDDNTIVTNGEWDFVQFHPSYDYTDFVEGLRPKKDNEQKEIGFELRNGVFKDFCKKAKNNPIKNYVFIIDEINRGEISKIFGELFFSIDPGYRGIKGKVKTQYTNIQTDETHFADDLENGDFYVPKNVYIIGTMNDIDRSVESFDFAMRRRFAWMEIKANENTGMLSKLGDLQEQAKQKLLAINNVIWDETAKKGIEGLSTAYHIGASYFLKLESYLKNSADSDNTDKWKNLWEYHLEPLLREYLRGMPDVETNLGKLKEAYKSPETSDENNG